jgi:hypothetical protein
MPHGYDVRADAPPAADVTANLARVREQIQAAAARTSGHEDFLQQYCPATPPAALSGSAR